MTILTHPTLFNERASHHDATRVSRTKASLAAFLTADDDWIARNQGKTIVFLLTAAMVVPEVIEWMI